MYLRHLKGRTYAIENNDVKAGSGDSANSGFSSAGMGLYLFDDQSCLLVDSGATPASAQKILQLLGANSWTVYAIMNTHAHADHCGGNHHIQESTQCRIYASAIEAAFINNPVLIPYTMYSACPPQLLTGKFFMPQASRVSHIIKPGRRQIKGKRFEVLDLAGHSPGQLGIITPDRILFAGDSLISQEILTANHFLYLADPAKQLVSLELLKSGDYEQLYLAHGGLAQDTAGVIKANEDILKAILNIIMDIIARPRSFENIIKEIIDRYGLQINRNHYFRLGNSISAFLSYLCNQGQARFYVDNHRLSYQAK